MALLFLLDPTPRFMVGDSEAYLMTQIGALPPDRSWIFGLLAHGVVRMTHGLYTYIALQLGLLASVLWLTLLAFRREVPRQRYALMFALLVACDPLTEAYARYYLSDLSASLLFIGFICLAAQILRPGVAAWPRSHRLLLGLGVVAFGVGAVLLRLAYVPVELATIMACMAANWRRADRHMLPKLALLGLVPGLAMATLIGANAYVFADRFPGESFANRSSGVFLMGVFSPALTAADIRQAGVAVSDTEVEGMRLTNYDNRINQVWGSEPFWLRSVVARRLAGADPYDKRVDAAGSKMVAAAFKRAPMSVVGVYMRTLGMYALPSQWLRHIDTELGLHRELDPWFVDSLNLDLAHKIDAKAPERPSALPALLGSVAGWYPVLLVTGLIVAALVLVGLGPVGLRLPAAGVVAVIVVVPLYSTYIIPRYTLPAVYLTWMLLPCYAGWRLSLPGRRGWFASSPGPAVARDETCPRHPAVKPGLSQDAWAGSLIPSGAHRPAREHPYESTPMQLHANPLVEYGHLVTATFRGRQVVAQSHRDSGYVFFSPPPAAELTEYYQHDYPASQVGYYTPDIDYEPGKNSYHAGRILDAYRLVLGGTPATSLELGCSFGGVVAEMARRGVDSAGSDINADAVAQGRRVKANLRISHASNLDAVRALTRRVDLIYSLHALEHDPDIFAVIEACRDRLSEDGLLYVSVPNAMAANSVLDGFTSNVWVNYPQHLHMLSAGFIPLLCEKTGFVPVFWDTRIVFALQETGRALFDAAPMGAARQALWETILCQAGHGMELNFVLAPAGGEVAKRVAERIVQVQGELDHARRHEVGIRSYLRDAVRTSGAVAASAS